MSISENSEVARAERARRMAKWATLGAAAALFIVGAVYSGVLFLNNSYAVSELAKDSAGALGQKLVGSESLPAESGGKEPGPGLPAKGAADPRFAFLLMGYGGGGHDGAYLTDSMMVVIVDPAQKTLTLLSLPRDAWVPILFDGQKPVYSKLNTAYAYARDSGLYTNRLSRYKGSQGAGLLAADTVSRILGIPIAYYLALDFAGFRQAIDAVGGIDVDIPDSFSAWYPANDDPSIDDSWTVVRFRKGIEHMNGERAIEYARARETIDNISEGTDFARSQRQRLIIEAFKSKLMQPEGLVHLPQLLAVAASHVDTNYSLPSVTQLTQLAMDWKNVRFFQAALTNTNYLAEATGPEGAYILVPDSPGQSWAPIRAVVRRLWENPELGVAMMNTEVAVENRTGVAGVASRLGDALSKLGYRVGTPTTGTVRPDSQALDRTDGNGRLLIDQLERDLGIHWSQVTTEKSSKGGILLQIGSDDAALAGVSVPSDATAPTSSYGVARAGGWSPAAPEPTPTATASASHSPTAEGSPIPSVVATPHPTSRTPVATPPVAHTPTPARSASPLLPTPPAPTPAATAAPSHPSPTNPSPTSRP